MSEKEAAEEKAEKVEQSKLMNNKLLAFHILLHFIGGVAAPVAGVLSTDAPLTNRVIALMIVLGIAGGAGAVRAFMSTSFADSGANQSSQPTKKVEIDQPPDKKVPVDITPDTKL